MNNKMKRVVGIILCCWFYFCAEAVAANVWTQPVQVTRIQQALGWPFIVYVSASENPDVCPKGGGYTLPLTGFPDVEKGYFYSTLLTAFVTGKKVKFLLNGCRSWPTFTQIIISD